MDPCVNNYEALRNAICLSNWRLVDLMLGSEKMDLSQVSEEIFRLSAPTR